MRYPDYYGIDMSRMSEFIAFKAAIELLKEREMRNIIALRLPEIQGAGRPAQGADGELCERHLRPFTDEEISAKMVELLTPAERRPKSRLSTNPWRDFTRPVPTIWATGTSAVDYPTRAGVKMLNKAFIDYIEQVYQF